jgi:lysophospholipase L1-like esterase
LRRFVAARAVGAVCALGVLAAGCSGSAGSSARTTAAHPGHSARPGAALARTPRYYLSLGDSLAVGVQPDADGASLPTSGGYPNRVYAVLHRESPGLRLVKLGCSGETSVTMIRGGICHYPAGSQLAQAERFLRAHHRQVALVTLDIGANDPNSCFLGAPLSKIGVCMRTRVRETVVDLNKILAGLRTAGGRQVPIVGMNYYVPELAGWFDGQGGKEIAVLTERLVNGYNSLLVDAFRHYHVRVANVFRAFHSGDFTDHVRLPGVGKVPRNVATICQLTWACARAPRGPNEHANDTGYAIIALAFLLADDR